MLLAVLQLLERLDGVDLLQVLGAQDPHSVGNRFVGVGQELDKTIALNTLVSVFFHPLPKPNFYVRLIDGAARIFSYLSCQLSCTSFEGP